MKVSFIIPLFNCLPLTQAMLASLRETLPPGFDCEVIFVDDGSTDGTRGWLKNLPAPCRTILNESNLGFAAACNRGAATAGGEYLFFLNNDLVLLPHWLEPMLAAFARCPAAGMVGNVQLNATTGAVDHAGIFFNYKGKPQHDISLPFAHRVLPVASYREVDALTGACFAVRREVWRQLGGFDEGFVNGSEDIDFALRARGAGLRHYVALRSVVRHHISASAGRKLRDEQNSYRLTQRWRTTIADRIARVWCWHHLATYWDEPRDFPDQGLARAAFYYVLHLRPTPPVGAVAGSKRAVIAELERWRAMFPGPG